MWRELQAHVWPIITVEPHCHTSSASRKLFITVLARWQLCLYYWLFNENYPSSQAGVCPSAVKYLSNISIKALSLSALSKRDFILLRLYSSFEYFIFSSVTTAASPHTNLFIMRLVLLLWDDHAKIYSAVCSFNRVTDFNSLTRAEKGDVGVSVLFKSKPFRGVGQPDGWCWNSTVPRHGVRPVSSTIYYVLSHSAVMLVLVPAERTQLGFK